MMEFYPGDIVHNGFNEHEVKAYYKDKESTPAGKTFHGFPAVVYTDGGWDREKDVTLVRRSWQKVTEDEYALLKRLGVSFEERTTTITEVRVKGGE